MYLLLLTAIRSTLGRTISPSRPTSCDKPSPPPSGSPPLAKERQERIRSAMTHTMITISAQKPKGDAGDPLWTREQLIRCLGMILTNGLDVYPDLGDDQTAGGAGLGASTLCYADANGKIGGDRFCPAGDCRVPGTVRSPQSFATPGRAMAYRSKWSYR